MRRLPSQLYDERKALIEDPLLLQAIGLAEDEVLADPSPLRDDRIEIDAIVYANSDHGVMLAYEIEGDGVRFLSFADTWNT